MRTFTLLLLGFIAITAVRAEENTMTLRFTANHTCTYIQLDSVLVENLTREGSRALYYPDTVLTIVPTFIDQLDEAYDGLYVSQNYPNPFSAVTDIDIYVPDPDLFRINVHDMSGRLLVVHDAKLEQGMHHFTFHACNQQSYLLTVNSGKYSQRRIMIQSGRGGRSTSRIEYNGMSRSGRTGQAESAPTIKATLKSSPGFDYEPGDELRFTGYVTSPFSYEIDYGVITDTPETDTDYLFDLADSAPDRPSDISGPETVMKYSGNLGYEIESSPGLTYNWSVPEGWSIAAGQGTNAVTVDSGAESGNIEVRAVNNCGEGPPSILHVTILHTLTLQASPPGTGTVTGAG
ncbi:MAG: T9SS C-terminal target domain-containing protein, partial [Marinilabiliales bacterium]